MSQKLLTPAMVAKRIAARTGKKPHISTVIRWIVNGSRGRKLPAIKQGSCWLIDPVDSDAYVQVVNGTPDSAVGRHADAIVGAQLEAMLGTATTAAADVVEVTVKPGAAVTVTKGAR